MGISVGIVGVGAFGRGFVGLFKRHPLVDRIAVCDIRSDRLSAVAREFEIAETYASLDDICRIDIQALVIITQPWLHAPQVIQALESGKHAYSAVPLAYSSDGDDMLEWCDRVIETCKRTGMHYMLGETSYYRPEAMYCRRRAQAGDFGNFVHAEGQYIHDVDWPACNLRDVARSRWGADWRPAKAGGIPMHYPTHSTGGFISVTRAHVTELCAFGREDPADDWHRADTESGNVMGNEIALMRMSNGATATIKEYRWVGAWGHEGFSVFGTKASFIDSFGQCRWITRDELPETFLATEEMRDPLPPEVAAAFRDEKGETEYGGHGGSHAYLVHEFVDAVAHNRTPAVNAWEAARYLAPGVIAHQSALRGGELMKVPDWGDAPG
ncbi:MAG: Gfo/Idh/MocA family oxidoreductase [Armatimonadota bacterium]|nr:MAG: Gfo/Idh/MocA family oxidoreductase [Armatimonadota bacterium]